MEIEKKNRFLDLLPVRYANTKERTDKNFLSHILFEATRYQLNSMPARERLVFLGNTKFNSTIIFLFPSLMIWIASPFFAL